MNRLFGELYNSWRKLSNPARSISGVEEDESASAVCRLRHKTTERRFARGTLRGVAISQRNSVPQYFASGATRKVMENLRDSSEEREILSVRWRTRRFICWRHFLKNWMERGFEGVGERRVQILAARVC